MLNSVVIVLRETLEASLLVSFLFVYSNLLNIRKLWMFWAILIGSVISLILAENFSEMSEWFDGAGQEVVFVFVLLSLAVLILCSNLLLISRFREVLNNRQYVFIYSLIIILAMSMEGAEIIVYFESRLANSEQLKSSLLGGILGLGIGVSVGAASYYLLSQLNRFKVGLCFSLLTMVSAGMVSQAISYLMQAGLVEDSYPIWDTSFLVSEASVLGQLLYALIGYEATPTFNQVVFYFLFIIPPFGFLVYSKLKTSNDKN